MSEIKTQAIVLSSTDYKDADKKLTLLSVEYGLIYATIKGVKKPKAKLAGASQPFCFAEFLLNKKGEYYTVINASVIENFFEVTNNFDKFIIGTGMLEFCKKTIKQNDPSVDLFVLLLKALRLLETKDANPMAALIRFLIDGLKIIGYNLKLDTCSCCGKKEMLSLGFNYSLEHGGIVCKKCGTINNSYILEPGEQGVIKNISITSIDDIFKLKFSSRENLISVIKILLRQVNLFIGEELTSIKQYL